MDNTPREQTLFNTHDAEFLNRYAQAARLSPGQPRRTDDSAPADGSMFREVARRITKEVREGTRQKYTTSEVEVVRGAGVQLFRLSMATLGRPGTADEQRVAAERQLAEADELLATAAKMEAERAPTRRRLAKG